MTYGGASGYDTVNAEQVLGKTWDGGSAMATVNYQANSDLRASARGFDIDNLVPYGGKNYLTSSCAPANVEVGTAEYSSPNLLPGGYALCNTGANADIINQNRRYSLVGTVRQEVGSNVLLSLDVKYSDDSEKQAIAANSVSSTSPTPIRISSRRQAPMRRPRRSFTTPVSSARSRTPTRTSPAWSMPGRR